MSKRVKPATGDSRTIQRLIRTEREVDKAELLGIRPVQKSRWPLTLGVGAVAAVAGALLVAYLLTGAPGEPDAAASSPAEGGEAVAIARDDAPDRTDAAPTPEAPTPEAPDAPTPEAPDAPTPEAPDAPDATTTAPTDEPDLEIGDPVVAVPPSAEDPPPAATPTPAPTDDPPAIVPPAIVPPAIVPPAIVPPAIVPPEIREDPPRATQPAPPRERLAPARETPPAEPAPAPAQQPPRPTPQPAPEPERVAPRQVQRTLTEMVRIPRRTLRFGALAGDDAALGNEQPPIEVTVEPFLMEVHQVTNRQYKEFLDATGYTPVPLSDDPSFTQYDWNPETRTYPRGQDDFPVVNVSRDDATAYAQWVGRRLPTEIEWEAAARMGAENVLYPWGNSFPDRVFANFDAQGLVQVQQYGSTGPGLYDIAGNAFEWVSDTYVADIHESFDPASYPPRGEGLGVLKGGAFYSTFREVRISYRENNSPSLRFFGYGFRLVADD